MDEQIAQILKMVEEGKITAHEAQGLIQALSNVKVDRDPVQTVMADTAAAAPGVTDTPQAEASAEEPAATSAGTTHETPPPPPPGSHQTPQFGGIVEAIEKLGKDLTTGVNWNEVGEQIRHGAVKAGEALKTAAEHLKDGKIGFFFGEVERRDVELPLSWAPGKTIRIENPSGNVFVNCEGTEAKVTAHAIFKGETRQAVEERAANYSLLIDESDHVIIIRQPDTPHMSADVDVILPEGVPIEVKCESGDVKIIGANGAVKVHGASGDVTAEKLKGSLEITTSSGDIKLSSSELSLASIENRSGDISVAEVDASLTVRTASGDIRVSGFKGRSASLEAVSGDVNFDSLVPVTGTVSARTVSGDINASIPDGSDCRVSLSTIRGDARSGIELDEQSSKSGHVSGRLGSGTGSLELSAVNGSLNLGLHDDTVKS